MKGDRTTTKPEGSFWIAEWIRLRASAKTVGHGSANDRSEGAVERTVALAFEGGFLSLGYLMRRSSWMYLNPNRPSSHMKCPWACGFSRGRNR